MPESALGRRNARTVEGHQGKGQMSSDKAINRIASRMRGYDSAARCLSDLRAGFLIF
jgi:hypothetical protein